MRMLTTGQAHRTAPCVMTFSHAFMLFEFHNASSQREVTHIFSMKIELNINLICIIMKLNMKTTVARRRGS